MRRKQPKRRAGNMVFSAIAGIFIVAIVGGIGLGASLADANDVGIFAFSSDDAAQASPSATEADDVAEALEYREISPLAYTSMRTLDSGMQMLDVREKATAEKQARDDAEVMDRVAAQKAMQGVGPAAQLANGQPDQNDPDETDEPLAQHDADSASDAGSPESPDPSAADDEQEAIEYDLPAVDWSVGRAAFMEEWTTRIDAYLKGSQLEGYGRVFAEAAWEHGVDPRWSPAISNTESGKGSACFLPHNAWGWGASSWSDWESAIRAHVAGLAEIYGYSITFEAAGVYCPPNQVHWYNTTLSEMSHI